MKTTFHSNPDSLASSLKLGSARLRSRIARQLPRGMAHHSPARFDTSLSLFNSLWSPIRLDLLKAPITRFRD